jgi:chromosome segregation protein
MLPYDNVTNTAQEKLFSIHLVLASLLAAPYPRGRILILDELADSLGAEHRREVLNAIATVAKQHGITILATCQDGIMADARPYCGEILYFHYPSKSAALNRPTRMFGQDRNGDRVELTAETLVEGRGRNPIPPSDS